MANTTRATYPGSILAQRVIILGRRRLHAARSLTGARLARTP